ncbi:hypothetical protein EL22_22270 [Halostagnicola sp. A56]|uniref:hypothetical protein n=1 Tax=Halostagnicola sp. A56 TaxID=1495067 RepID=UPI0004A1192F|nr:hypothetical protein [Halostagnicola sp. A56]KDE60459.1 hypothetical protein EL22_22270 [Halostagnicola sp. A56]
MVETRVTDGRRIAELLASEIDGREDGHLERLAVVDADTDVEPTTDGARAYDVEQIGEPEGMVVIARVFVHEDRVRVEFERGHERAAAAAESVGLRVRPKATTPPKTLVFVEDGGEVKRASDVFDDVSQSIAE